MELKILVEEVLKIFDVSKVDDLENAIMDCVISQNEALYDKYLELLPDLSIDYMQKIFQYHYADRKEKKQDFTPNSLSKFVSVLCGNSDIVIDMCAGSGALTISKWSDDKEAVFELYEIDSKVMPFLLFNMAVRNINCTVYNADVLQNEVFKKYVVLKTDKYGKVKEF